MSVDPYSLCPCGSGKKLKFCCTDLVGDIEKIHRMIEGDQPRAALQHVEKTLRKRPGRASLLDLKALLEVELGQLEAAEATVAEFLEKDPNNPTAYAQQAMLASAKSGGHAGVEPLQKALGLVEDHMPQRVLEAVGVVGQTLLAVGAILAARAHLWLYQGIAGREDTRALELLMRMNQLPGMPLLLRDHVYMIDAPEGDADEARHDQAQLLAAQGRWRQAADIFDELCERRPDMAGFLYNRALLYGWLGDTERLAEGLSDYARRDVPLDDAVEAEALAQLLDPKNEQRQIEILRRAYPVRDQDSLFEKLSSDKRLAPYQFDPDEDMSPEDGPPPVRSYLLLDRPQTEPGADVDRETVPRLVGLLHCFGRQTDRQERLELVADQDERFEEVTAMIPDICGDSIGEPEGQDESIGAVGARERLLSWRWRLPPDLTPQRRRELNDEQRRHTILELWPDMPEPTLGGKTPRDAAADPSLRIALLAAVLVLEQGLNNQQHAALFNDLREKLNLPVPDPIDPAEADIERLPLVRIPRLDLESISDEDLKILYRRATLASARGAILRISREVVRRPDAADGMSIDQAYSQIIQLEDDTAAALATLDDARKRSEAAGESTAGWDMAELQIHVMEGASGEATRVLRHIQQEHLEEPGVAEQLYRLLYAIGAISPEQAAGGAGMPGGGAPLPAMPPASAAGPGQPPGGIWTPDSDRGGEAAQQKLWIPS